MNAVLVDRTDSWTLKTAHKAGTDHEQTEKAGTAQNNADDKKVGHQGQEDTVVAQTHAAVQQEAVMAA